MTKQFGISIEHFYGHEQLGRAFECYGFGVDSLEEALEEGQTLMAFQRKVSSAGTKLRLLAYRFCASCGVTGIKRGCKRKACPDCQGTGRVETIQLLGDQ